MRTFLVIATTTLTLLAVVRSAHSCSDGAIRIIGTAIADVYHSDSSSETDSSSESSSDSSLSSIEETVEFRVNQEEISRRKNLVSEIQKLPVWEALNEDQQKRLTHAIINDFPIPQTWIQQIRSYSDLLDPKNTDFLRQPTVIESFPDVSNEQHVATDKSKSAVASLI